MEKKKISYEVLQGRGLTMQICVNLSPDEMAERKKEVECLLPYSGTTMGWQVDLEHDYHKPVPCADISGRWHYICVC